MQRLFRLILLGLLGSMMTADGVQASEFYELGFCRDSSTCRWCQSANSNPATINSLAPDKNLCTKTPLPGLLPTGFSTQPDNRLVSARINARLSEDGSNQTNPIGSIRPRTNGQLYAQRIATLRAGELYSRIPPETFVDQWQTAWQQPTYQEWQTLLRHEAALMAIRQGDRRLTVLVGDSLYLWMPPEYLSGDRLWLNQSISGETTTHVLQRLNYFASAQPSLIYVMAGVNDIKNGVAPEVIASNMELIVQRLKIQHPQARIVVLSILPTRWSFIPGETVRQVNLQIARTVRRRGVQFMDLQSIFMDSQGLLQEDLTTDGIHLSSQGYNLLTTYLNRLI